MAFTTIAWDVSDGIGTLTFNRPDRLNGITNTMTRELHELLHTVAADDSVAFVVVTGAGKAFCPGADLNHYSAGEADEPLRPESFDVPVLLHEMPQVTIAAINGACGGAARASRPEGPLRRRGADGLRRVRPLRDRAPSPDLVLGRLPRGVRGLRPEAHADLHRPLRQVAFPSR